MKNLMIVDMQKGQMRGNNSSLIAGINELLRNGKFENIFFTRYFNHADSMFAKVLKYDKMIAEKDIEICVDSVEGSFIFPKETYGLANEQIAYLKQKNIDEVLICGTDYDACVLAVAFNLFDNGIRPFFKWDLCGTKNQNPIEKEKIKALLQRNFGQDCIIE